MNAFRQILVNFIPFLLFNWNYTLKSYSDLGFSNGETNPKPVGPSTAVFTGDAILIIYNGCFFNKIGCPLSPII